MGLKTRSVIQFGDGGFAITLPADFVRENKLKAKDRIYVLLNRRSLFITVDKAKADELADKFHDFQSTTISEAHLEEIEGDEEKKG